MSSRHSDGGYQNLSDSFVCLPVDVIRYSNVGYRNLAAIERSTSGTLLDEKLVYQTTGVGRRGIWIESVMHVNI